MADFFFVVVQALVDWLRGDPLQSIHEGKYIGKHIYIYTHLCRSMICGKDEIFLVERRMCDRIGVAVENLSLR